MAAALLACNDNTTPVVRVVARAYMLPLPNMTDAKRLSDGANKLIDAMKKPTGSFHFSFKGQETEGGQDEAAACWPGGFASGCFPGRNQPDGDARFNHPDFQCQNGR